MKRRVFTGLVDQISVSLVGLIIGALGAKTLSTQDFGFFATLLAVHYASFSLFRGFFGEVLLLGRAERRAQSAVRAAAIFVVGYFLIVISVGGVLDQLTLAASFAAASAASLLFDCARIALFVERGAAYSAIQSFVALAAVVSGAIFYLMSVDSGAIAIFLVWVIGSLAGLVAQIGLRLPQRERRASIYVKESYRMGLRFAVEALVSSGGLQLALVVVAVLASPLINASIRASALVLSPLSFLVQAALPIVASEARRTVAGGERRIALSATVILGVTAVAYGLVILFVPNIMLAVLSEENRAAASTTLLAMWIAATCSVALIGPIVQIRVSGRLRAGSVLRLTSAPLIIILPIASVLVWKSAASVGWSIAIVGVVQLAAWIYVAFFGRSGKP